MQSPHCIELNRRATSAALARFLDIDRDRHIFMNQPGLACDHRRRCDPRGRRLRRRRQSHLARCRADPRRARDYRRHRAWTAQQSAAHVWNSEPPSGV